MLSAETAGLEEEDLKLNVEETIRQLTNLKCEEGPVSRQKFADVIDLAIAALKRMERQEQQRWIPEEERLPEKDGNYLVTLYDSTERWTEVLYWNSTFGGRWQGLIEDDLSDIGNVSAWRPLPDPYQEDEA